MRPGPNSQLDGVQGVDEVAEHAGAPDGGELEGVTDEHQTPGALLGQLEHSGVVSAFGRLLVRDRGINEQAGRLPRSLFERRSQADYEVGSVPVEEAHQAVVDAAFVVETVEQWLHEAP